MTFIVTALGNEVNMRYPTPGAINLATIAHHLSQINRFCGATCRPYSVAEHSLLVCEIAAREYHLNCHGLFAALMHDAHEAYTNDLATPAKREIEGWGAFEGRFERLVRSCFGLHTAAYTHRDAIRHADLLALATERHQLLPPGGTQWEVLIHIEPLPWVDLLDKHRCSFTWADWRQAFTDRANELDFERDLRAATLGREPNNPTGETTA